MTQIENCIKYCLNCLLRTGSRKRVIENNY